MKALKRILVVVFFGVFALPFFTIHKRANMVSVQEAPALEFQNTETESLQTHKMFHQFTITKSASTSRAVLGTKCRQTYFWGGGKAGSTSLYFTLAGKKDVQKDYRDHHQETRAFVRCGVGGVKKEPCYNSEGWQEWKNMTRDSNLCNTNSLNSSVILDENKYTKSVQVKPSHILNGCPKHTTTFEAKQLMELGDEHVTFLMLIRDPVDRFVSQLNDEIRRSKRDFNFEELVQKAIKIRLRTNSARLSFQGLALKNLLSVVNDTKKILIIPMESLTVDMQGVVDAIMIHVGGESWNINRADDVHMNKGANGKRKRKYMTISKKTTETLRDMFRADVQLLEGLIGKRFPWSSWARNSTDTNDDNWLTTTPLA